MFKKKGWMIFILLVTIIPQLFFAFFTKSDHCTYLSMGYFFGFLIGMSCEIVTTYKQKMHFFNYLISERIKMKLREKSDNNPSIIEMNNRIVEVKNGRIVSKFSVCDNQDIIIDWDRGNITFLNREVENGIDVALKEYFQGGR